MTAAVKKFDFNNSFDMTERGMVAARDYTLGDVEDSHRRGVEEGRVQGLAEAGARAEQASAHALEAIATRLEELSRGLADIREGVEHDMADTLRLIARKVVPHYAETHALEEIDALVKECFASLHEEPRVVIRVHDTVLDGLKSRIEGLAASAGFGGKAVLFSDASLAPNDCRVEWADGGAERNLDRLMTDIESALRRSSGTHTGSPGQSSGLPPSGHPPTGEDNV